MADVQISQLLIRETVQIRVDIRRLPGFVRCLRSVRLFSGRRCLFPGRRCLFSGCPVLSALPGGVLIRLIRRFGRRAQDIRRVHGKHGDILRRLTDRLFRLPVLEIRRAAAAG